MLGQACRGLGLLLGALAGLGLVWWLILMIGLAVAPEAQRPLWLLGLVLVLAGLAYLALRFGGLSAVSAGMILLATVILFAIGITLYQDVGLKARLAADQGTVAALRAAAAIYYARNQGTWPTKETLNTLVPPSPTVLQCPGARWDVDTTTGTITYTPNDLSACR